MEQKLYYCEPWPHRKVEVGKEKFEICISPKINGNNEGTTIQYHGLILKDSQVARIGLLDKNISQEQAEFKLASLEEKLRETIRLKVIWNNNMYDNGAVKIWYYEEGDEITTCKLDKRKYPPLRFAITVININPLNDSDSIKIRDGLEHVVIDWIDSIVQ